MTSSKVLRAIVGVLVLLVLLVLVLNWFGDYRSASRKPSGSDRSSTATETSSAETPGGDATADGAGEESTTPSETEATQLIVTVDGLNFRREPRSDSKAMRGLKNGERVDLLEDLGDWYKVRDKDGVEGYITSSSSYTRSAD